MSLFREIQEAIVDSDTELTPVLLKLRLLADRLGSHQLEEWVKYESEGYPSGVDVPEYRQIEMSYTGSFHNIAWKADHQPIPTYLIEKYCGDSWTKYKVRESIGAIDGMVRKMEDGGRLGIDASNLILKLQGKIYKDMNCTSVEATFSEVALREIQNIVRGRALELTMKLEKEVPDVVEVTIGKSLDTDPGTANKVEQVIHTAVYGSNAVVVSGSAHSNVTINNSPGDLSSLRDELVNAGIPHDSAEEFSQLVSIESADGKGKPFGEKTIEWLKNNLPAVANGAWGITVSVATKILEDAARKYYGLD